MVSKRQSRGYPKRGLADPRLCRHPHLSASKHPSDADRSLISTPSSIRICRRPPSGGLFVGLPCSPPLVAGGCSWVEGNNGMCPIYRETTQLKAKGRIAGGLCYGLITGY